MRLSASKSLLVAAILAAVAWGEAPQGQYTDRGDGTVKDNRTGLLWQQHHEGGFTLVGAQNHCLGLRLGGFLGWRVPTRLELESIVDFGHRWATTATASLDQTAFWGDVASTTWTSTPYAGDSTQVWVISFAGGRAYHSSTSELNAVRCVH